MTYPQRPPPQRVPPTRQYTAPPPENAWQGYERGGYNNNSYGSQAGDYDGRNGNGYNGQEGYARGGYSDFDASYQQRPPRARPQGQYGYGREGYGNPQPQPRQQAMRPMNRPPPIRNPPNTGKSLKLWAPAGDSR